jgi:hypothetical protein
MAFSFMSIFSGLSKLAAIFAQFDPDPVTKLIASAIPIAYNLAQEIEDPATAQVSFEQNVQMAAIVASQSLTGGAANTYATVIAPKMPEITDAMKEIDTAVVAAFKSDPNQDINRSGL